jgi:hypothetical protein
VLGLHADIATVSPLEVARGRFGAKDLRDPNSKNKVKTDEKDFVGAFPEALADVQMRTTAVMLMGLMACMAGNSTGCADFRDSMQALNQFDSMGLLYASRNIEGKDGGVTDAARINFYGKPEIVFGRGAIKTFREGEPAVTSLGYHVDQPPGVLGLEALISHETAHGIDSVQKLPDGTPRDPRDKESRADDWTLKLYPELRK